MEIEIAELIKRSIRKEGVHPGVFFLFDDVKKEKPVYVGSSWNCFLSVAEQTRKEPKRHVEFTKWNSKHIEENYRAAKRQISEVEIEKLYKNSMPKEGKCPGVYFLFDEEKLVYIGSGWNCLLRVAEHTRKEPQRQVKFTKWNYIEITGENEYRAEEERLIRKYQPRGNKTHIRR